MWKRSFLRLRNLSYVYENHVQRNAMTGIRSSMKMTRRCGSRMISKAERRLERHRRDYMGRVHVYTLLSALPRIFPSLPVSSDPHLHPFSFSSSCYFFLPLYDERVAHSLHPHLRPIICCFRSERLFSTDDIRIQVCWLLNGTIENAIISLVKSIHCSYSIMTNRIIFQEKAFIFHFAFTFI